MCSAQQRRCIRWCCVALAARWTPRAYSAALTGSPAAIGDWVGQSRRRRGRAELIPDGHRRHPAILLRCPGLSGHVEQFGDKPARRGPGQRSPGQAARGRTGRANPPAARSAHPRACACVRLVPTCPACDRRARNDRALTARHTRDGVAGATATRKPLGDLLAICAPRPALGRMNSTIVRAQLDRASTAAPLFHQPRHPRLIETPPPQMKRCPRIRPFLQRLRPQHSRSQTFPHLSSSPHLVGGPKRSLTAGERRRVHPVTDWGAAPRLG